MSVVEYRRALHKVPELDDKLPKTVAIVRGVLASLPCAVTSPIEGSLCAYFDAGRSETVAFRADMDALPVSEATGLPFASTHKGCMHACGHDGHTAMVLALARYAALRVETLPRNLLLIFQPSEETTGGAGRICETGLLERHNVSRIFGMHLWPGLTSGVVGTRPGPLMARSNEVTVTITGRSVHLSKAKEGRDAMTAGVEYLSRVYDMSRSLPPEQKHVLLFGKMTSGTVRNAVSGKTRLEGSLRTYREETFCACRNALHEIGHDVARKSGCDVHVHLSQGYPAVWNDEELYDKVSKQLGEDAPILIDEPSLAAEDFSFYQKRVPGIFFFLGVGDTPQLHAPDFDFDDEAVLPKGLAFLKKLLTLP